MRILDLMQADGLTREHVASHLQVIGALTMNDDSQDCTVGAKEQMSCTLFGALPFAWSMVCLHSLLTA